MRLTFVLCIVAVWAPAVHAQADSLKDRNGDVLPPGAIARLGALRFRIGGATTEVRFVDAGKKLLVNAPISVSGLNDDGCFYLFDVESGRELNRFVADYSNLRNREIDSKFSYYLTHPQGNVSPDGKFISIVQPATPDDKTSLQLREIASNKIVFSIADVGCHFHKVQFSANAKYMAVIAATALDDREGGKKIQVSQGPKETQKWTKKPHTEIRVWEMASWKKVGSFILPEQTEEKLRAVNYAFSPDCASLAASYPIDAKSSRAQIWDMASQKPVWGVENNDKNGGRAPFAFSPDSKVVAALHAGKICLWDAATGQQVKEVADSLKPCATLQFSPDGKRLIACKPDDSNARGPGRMLMWDLASGTKMDLPVDLPVDFLFSKSGDTLVIADRADSNLLICDGVTGKKKNVIKVAKASRHLTGTAWPFDISPDGKTLVVADAPGQVRRFEIATAKEIPPPGIATDVAEALAFSPDGKKLLAVGATRVLLHDVDDNQPPVPLLRKVVEPIEPKERDDYRVRVGNRMWPNSSCAVFSADGKLAAAGWKDGMVTLWDTTSGTPLWQSQANEYPIHSLAFSDETQTLLSAGLDGQIIWWNISNGKIWRKSLLAATSKQSYYRDIYPLHFGLGGHTVWGTTSSAKRELEEWELATGKLRRKINVVSEVLDMASDGHSMLIMGENAYHSVDLLSSEPRRSFGWSAYPQPENNPYGWCRFSPNGQLVAGIVNENVIRVWDSRTATMLTTITGDNGGFRTLAFAPDGKTLATAGSDGTILIWQMPNVKTAPSALAEIKADEWAGLWQKLTGSDAEAAGKALHRLAAADGVVKWLGDKLALQIPSDESARLRIVELLDRIGTQEAKALLKLFVDSAASWPARSAHASLQTFSSVKLKPQNNDAMSVPQGALARLGSLRFQAGADLTNVRYSPDGKSIFAITSSGEQHWEVINHQAVFDSVTGHLQSQTFIRQEQMFRMGKLSDPIPLWQFSPDGKLLATSNVGYFGDPSNNLPSLCVREIATGKIMLGVEEDVRNIAYLRFSPHGNTLITIDRFSGAVKLFDLTKKQMKELEKAPGNPFHPLEATFSPDGQILLIGGNDDKGRVEFCWHYVGRGLQVVRMALRPFQDERPAHERYDTFPIRFAPDSKHIVLVSADTQDKKPHLLLVAVESGIILRDFGEYPEMRPSFTFSPDGKQVMAHCKGKLRRWNVDTGKELEAVPGGYEKEIQFTLDGKTKEIQFAPDGKTFAICAASEIRLHETMSGRELHRIPLDSQIIEAMLRHNAFGQGAGEGLAFSPDGKTLALAYRRTIRRWDVTTGKEIEPAPYSQTIHAVAVANGSQTVAAATSHEAQVWDASAGKLVMRVLAWPDADKKTVSLTAVALSTDGRRLAVGGSDGTVAFFDVPKGKRLTPIRAHNAAVISIVFLADGNTALSADLTHGVMLWDANTGAKLRKIEMPAPTSIKVLKSIAGGPELWHERFESSYFFWPRQLAPALSPDGRQLVVSSQASVALFELASSKPRGVNYPMPRNGKTAVSRDGRLLVIGPDWSESYYIDRDSALHLIDVATGVEMRIVANFPRIRDFCISPDGKFLAACSTDGIRIWDTATGTHQATMYGHRGIVTTLCFSPDGGTLVSAAYDGTLLVWNMAEVTSKKAIRELTAGELATLWQELGSSDAALGAEAMRRLAANPKQTVRLFVEKVKPVTMPKADIAEWVADLDSLQFKVRAKATKDLEDLGELAEPALRARLAGKPSLEQRMRIEKLLAQLSEPIANSGKLRALRAVEVLELLGTEQAVELLRLLAGGLGSAYETRQAQAALRRSGVGN